MRKLLIALSALAAFGIVLPAATGTAQAETVVIKHGNHGHHYGWRNHHRTKVVIRHGRGHHYGWSRHHHHD